MKTQTLIRRASWLAVLALGACASMDANTPQAKMTFFVTSVNPGKGADLGGLAGADAHCQALATTVGAGKRTWRAYLATTRNGQPDVNARDRIGKGPWQNVKGDVIAVSVDDLHSANNKLNKQTALTEKGTVVNGRGDTPNMHDILTGTQPSGIGIAGNVDSTCSNWTSSGAGAAMVGHSDRIGLDESVPAKSWNSSHQSRGCSMDALKSTGGAGLFYCFAVN
ncbi:MAG: hypothetical protein IPG91_21555 [Ideonella sp.]|nr:hypothetical protein [Ideonella sp.]